MTESRPFERILIAHDPEGLASGALLRGLGLAQMLDARVNVLTTIEVPPTLWVGQDVTHTHAPALARAREQAALSLDQARREAGHEAGSTLEMLHVVPGHAAHEILRAAREFDSDLILLGPHSKRSIFDFGSTARAVLAQAHVPVWTQPAGTLPILSILVATDFSDHSRRALDCAHALASAVGASIRLVHCHVPHPPALSSSIHPMPISPEEAGAATQAAKADLQRWVGDYEWGSVHAEPLFVEGAAVDAIVEAAKTSDLIVVGTHGRTGLSRFLLGSVAYGTLKHATQPVLVVPDPGREWMMEGA